MEKVKLTQEQADAVESKMNTTDIDLIMDLHRYKDARWGNDSEALNELSNSELAKALYIGYEVEPEFKIGDWKVVEYSREIGQVVEYFKEKQRVELDCSYFTYKKGDLRDATPEEIAEEKEYRFWKRNGRNVWELRFDDLLIHKEKHELIRVVDVQFKGEVIVFINAGYRESLNISYVKQMYNVVCFADDRKDVKE